MILCKTGQQFVSETDQMNFFPQHSVSNEKLLNK